MRNLVGFYPEYLMLLTTDDNAITYHDDFGMPAVETDYDCQICKDGVWYELLESGYLGRAVILH